MKISRQTRKAIAGQSVAGLAKFKDDAGNRLHHSAIKTEIERRVSRHMASHPKIRRLAAKKASRKLK